MARVFVLFNFFETLVKIRMSNTIYYRFKKLVGKKSINHLPGPTPISKQTVLYFLIYIFEYIIENTNIIELKILNS